MTSFAPWSLGYASVLTWITFAGPEHLYLALGVSPAVSVLPFLCQQWLQSLKWSFRPAAWLPEIKPTPKIYKASLEESCAEVPKQHIEFSDSHKYPATYYKGWVQFKEHSGNQQLFKWMCQDLLGILRAIRIHNPQENSRSLWAVLLLSWPALLSRRQSGESSINETCTDMLSRTLAVVPCEEKQWNTGEWLHLMQPSMHLHLMVHHCKSLRR